jgi:flagella basal body P-ring formation protein FlgA
MRNSYETSLSKRKLKNYYSPIWFGFLLCCSPLAQSASTGSNDNQIQQNLQNDQDVRNAIKQFLINESTGLPGKVTVEVGAIDARLNLTPCTAIEPYLPPGTRLWGRVNVGVRCVAPAHWNLFVPSTIKVSGNYYVSARAIMQGQLLSEADIASVQGELTSLSSNIVTDPAQAIGHTSTMSLGAGLALRQDSLRLQQVVMQGQTIRLVSNGDGFKVSTDGLALNGASEGQLVKVKITSGQVISGTAKMGGIVEVNN